MDSINSSNLSLSASVNGLGFLLRRVKSISLLVVMADLVVGSSEQGYSGRADELFVSSSKRAINCVDDVADMEGQREEKMSISER